VQFSGSSTIWQEKPPLLPLGMPKVASHEASGNTGRCFLGISRQMHRSSTFRDWGEKDRAMLEPSAVAM